MAKKSKKEEVEIVSIDSVELPSDIVIDSKISVENKPNKQPDKEFVKDWKELKKVEGYKQTDRGKLYYGVKK